MRLRTLLLITVAYLVMGCDPDAVPLSIEQILESNGKSWKIASLSSETQVVDESEYVDVRYTFSTDADGNPTTYEAMNVPITMTSQGLRPDYYTSSGMGTWEVTAGQRLIFDIGQFTESEVEIIGTPRTDLITLEWYTPEDFIKLAPIVTMELIPAND